MKKNSTITTTADTSIKTKNARLILNAEQYAFVLNLAQELVLRGSCPVDAANSAMDIIRTVAKATSQA